MNKLSYDLSTLAYQMVSPSLRGVLLELSNKASQLEKITAWRPIDSAPLDGTSILVMDNDQPGYENGVADACEAHNTAVAAWWCDENNSNGEWVCYMSMVQDPLLHFEPTHWMPLPGPPGIAY